MINLAGKSTEEADEQTKIELDEAGIQIIPLGSQKGEVKTRNIGVLYGWSFDRAWYYWRAKGPGIPPAYANELQLDHGETVRVEGDAGGSTPYIYNKGFAVGSYHIDDQKGLNAFANMLHKIIAEAKEDPRLMKKECEK